ncbi:MAG: Gfo/Idh/MocA family oxidoreductase [Verrucomicrobia bacterium]|nr:Gfo/Idh/MocA family oxidoreductase [Verrucomicrobiota bacterium]
MNSSLESSLENQSTTSISRRRFLAQTGLGLATASALSARPTIAADAGAKVRLGVIGCGGRGSWIANLFAEHGGYEIVGVADFFQDRVETVATKLQLKPEQTFTGLKCAEKLIAKGGLDAVAIISPPYFHPEQARTAVEAGLNVYVAKPIAVDVPGAKSIEESGKLATKKGLVFQVDFQTRANEFFIEAMKRVHAGAIGEIVFGESSYQCGRLGLKGPIGTTPEARLRNWAFDIALSGDIIVEQNIHTLDVMNWAMNHVPPVRCTGTGGRKVRVDVGDCWDNFQLTYEYPNKVGIAFNSRQFDCDAPGGIINKMYGSKGALLTEYGGNVMIRGAGDTFYRGGRTNAIYKEGTQTNIKTFHEKIGKKDVSNSTVPVSVRSNLIAIMGRMAAYTGHTVTWDDVMKSKEKLDAHLGGMKA